MTLLHPARFVWLLHCHCKLTRMEHPRDNCTDLPLDVLSDDTYHLISLDSRSKNFC